MSTTSSGTSTVAGPLDLNLKVSFPVPRPPDFLAADAVEGATLSTKVMYNVIFTTSKKMSNK